MSSANAGPQFDLFISYASRDFERVVAIVDQLEQAGFTIWRDKDRILGGGNYGPEIVRGIRGCNTLLLMCSEASMRSRNVKQEIQLAWKYQRPYLPLLLDDSVVNGFPDQVEYWLEGCQWIEVLDLPSERWLPRVLQSTRRTGAQDAFPSHTLSHVESETPSAVQVEGDLTGLVRLASFTDQIWPVPADAARREVFRGRTRGLGAPQPAVRHGFPLGSRVRIKIEIDRPAHLLLLDSGPEGITYCLCPSAFVPQTQLEGGTHVLPQSDSHYESFLVTGQPGRERLLAILTDEPLGLNWTPNDPDTQPARVIDQNDINRLLRRLQSLDVSHWTSLATYFDVIA
jgi:hypothetical protein